MSPGEASERGARGGRVLLIEDDGHVRRALTTILSTAGYQTVAVGSGEEALALPGEPGFAVVISDLVLPGLGGLDLVSRLRVRWPTIAVVLMSGYGERDLPCQDASGRPIGVLRKPFGPDALFEVLRAARDA